MYRAEFYFNKCYVYRYKTWWFGILVERQVDECHLPDYDCNLQDEWFKVRDELFSLVKKRFKIPASRCSYHYYDGEE